jgi:hypothetical protein
MNKCALVTTLYCDKCPKPTTIELKNKFNYDGDNEDIFINFSDYPSMLY